MHAGTTTVEPEVTERTELAPQWKVLLLDDDHTTFEFVIWLLMSLFRKPRLEAIELTYEIHQSGAALVAVANLERAELYVEQVHSLARPRGFPLTAEIEPA
ncbi:MAG: ATP-dependent Clp protease adaptor ClpS [Planctomycetota bacterium]|nr:ATP-dependent Clp protease adaptor ClpS [Planctomycetota bacterium]